jgi:hypothetical protein
MHDSLDLGLLKSQIATERKATRRTWVIFFLVSAIITVVTFMMVVPPPGATDQQCRCAAAMLELGVALIWTILLIGGARRVLL